MQKSGFPKMRHYVGFSQIGSRMAIVVIIINGRGLGIDMRDRN